MKQIEDAETGDIRLIPAIGSCYVNSCHPGNEIWTNKMPKTLKKSQGSEPVSIQQNEHTETVFRQL